MALIVRSLRKRYVNTMKAEMALGGRGSEPHAGPKPDRQSDARSRTRRCDVTVHQVKPFGQLGVIPETTESSDGE